MLDKIKKQNQIIPVFYCPIDFRLHALHLNIIYINLRLSISPATFTNAIKTGNDVVSKSWTWNMHTEPIVKIVLQIDSRKREIYVNRFTKVSETNERYKKQLQFPRKQYNSTFIFNCSLPSTYITEMWADGDVG